ncbi:MAG: sugar phosphate isomerase/epimerase family protein [Rhodospirillales bacterium]
MRFSLCNEVIAQLDFAKQCDYAAALGYEGLEVAPFTFDDNPHLIGANQRAAIRRAAKDAGIAVSGLHWLLIKPANLSITSADPAVRERTLDVMRRLIGLCADLGGEVLVHGSPGQRRIPDGPDAVDARQRGGDAFAAIAEDAAKAGVTYCIEPLAPPDANFVNTVEQAAEIVRAIGNPHLRTMVDCSAAGKTESQPVEQVLDRWLPTGMVAHIQFNDPNRRGPGQGEMKFAPILAALKRHGYQGWAAVEPFDYLPDGVGSAARAIGYLRGIEESLT